MEKQSTANYNKDSKRYDRFMIDEDQRITGMIHVLSAWDRRFY